MSLVKLKVGRTWWQGYQSRVGTDTMGDRGLPLPGGTWQTLKELKQWIRVSKEKVRSTRQEPETRVRGRVEVSKSDERGEKRRGAREKKASLFVQRGWGGRRGGKKAERSGRKKQVSRKERRSAGKAGKQHHQQHRQGADRRRSPETAAVEVETVETEAETGARFVESEKRVCEWLRGRCEERL
jgi:hypothetical protein